MLIKYQNILFKLPKFPELDYLSEEKKNEFIYVLLDNLYKSLNKKDNYFNIVDYGKLTNKFNLYGIGDFQSVLKSKKETQLVFNNDYIETV